MQNYRLIPMLFFFGTVTKTKVLHVLIKFSHPVDSKTHHKKISWLVPNSNANNISGADSYHGIVFSTAET